jgi:hypothetical protein
VRKINYSLSFLALMNHRNINNEKQINRFDEKIDTFEFSPQDINLKDDAYHGSKGLQFTEWWYFDAALNDGYSIQLVLEF